jgi:hypothetical protein
MKCQMINIIENMFVYFPVSFIDPRGVIYSAVSSTVAPCSPSEAVISERSRGERYLSKPSSQILISKPSIRNHQFYNRYYDH